jgi:hypothetical protein
MLEGSMTPTEYDDFREQWREMGRTVIEQIRDGEYERREVVPFAVTTGRV